MKTKLLAVLATGCLVVVIAWLVHEPAPVQADKVPEKYQAMVNKGLEFLVKHQHADGHWEGDGGSHPVAMTGLVGLALVMEKENARSTRFGERRATTARYAANIRKAADWLLGHS